MQVMQEGQTIKHEVYGLGIVTASDAERTTVDFDDHGPKLFVTSIMTAELIGEAPDQAASQSRHGCESGENGRGSPFLDSLARFQVLPGCQALN